MKKISWFHRRRLLGLVAIIMFGIYMDHLSLSTWQKGKSTILYAQTTDPLTLSWAQPDIQLIIWPGIGRTRTSQAKKTTDRLRGVVYAISDRETKIQLAKSAQIGTNIRIMLENKPFSYTNKTYDSIEEIADKYSNFHLQTDEILDLKYLHSKYFIFDDTAIIQTSNLTRSGLYKNLEHAVLIRDPNIIESLTYLFEKDRKGEPIDMQKIDPHLVVCPINCRSVIEKALSSAEHSIDIMTQYIYDPALIKILKKTPENIHMRLLLSDSSGNQNIVDYFGPKTAQMYTSRKHYLHTKTFLIDNRRLLIGSMNLSDNSLDNNRELGIIITDPQLIQKFKKWFEKYWK